MISSETAKREGVGAARGLIIWLPIAVGVWALIALAVWLI